MTSPCHICIYWTPENGCKHYLPDSETILLKAGYKIYRPGIDTKQKKFVIVKGTEQHKFESLAKAARVLIHDKTIPNETQHSTANI